MYCKQDIEADAAYDLSQVRSHYESRMQLRANKMVLRYGELCPLAARNEETEHYATRRYLSDVLTFARYSLMETVIVAINLSESDSRFYVDMAQL